MERKKKEVEFNVPQYRSKLKAYYENLYGTTFKEALEKGKLVSTIGQATEDYRNRPKPMKGYWWGYWKLGARDELTYFNPENRLPIYTIDVKDIKTKDDMLSIICHFLRGRIISTELVGSLFLALYDIKQEEIKELTY